MFKFGRKDKSKDKSEDKKKEHRESKKGRKSKENSPQNAVGEETDRSAKAPPPVAPKPRPVQSSVLSINLKSPSKPLTPKGILKLRSSLKSKNSDPVSSPLSYDDVAVLQENTRYNEEMVWRTPPDASQPLDRRKRESIHSITMNIAPPSIPPPDSPTEKVYSVSLELPSVTKPDPASQRALTIYRQSSGDFGFNLRWAAYSEDPHSLSRPAVFAEPGTSGSKSGVIAGDRILEINGRNVELCTREQVISLIQQSADPLQLKVQQIPEVKEISKRSIPNTKTLDNDAPDSKPYMNGGSADYMWLVHRGGYSRCFIQSDSTNSAEGRCKIKVEKGGDVLEVDENDLERCNPESLARIEQLSSLIYLNESSILHVMRQRYGSSLIHTIAGKELVVVNPRHPINIYSHRVMQMIKAYTPVDLPPHVFSQAQKAYQAVLSTSKDQSIVLSGRTGSGKTTSLKNILNYYCQAYGGVHSNSLDEKLAAAQYILESFGNCVTKYNDNATRFAQTVTLDFDNYGRVTSSFVQMSMLEKSRVVNQRSEESSFHVFNYLLYGADPTMKQELLLHHATNKNNFIKSEVVDKDKSVSGWSKCDLAMRILAISPEESKVIYQIVSAVIHLGAAGVTRGANGKIYFADPGSAQNAAKLLGTSMEELSKTVFSPPSSSNSLSNLRNGGLEDDLQSAYEALEGFAIGLYTEAVSAVVTLVNRSTSSVARNPRSISILDIPGMRVEDTSPATFEDLCYNYVNERLQLVFHNKTFSESQERYNQENIEADLDPIDASPEAMVKLLDKCTNQQLNAGNSRVDLSLLGVESEVDAGILWLLDECALTPGFTEQKLMDKILRAHAEQAKQRERILSFNPATPTLLTLHHGQGAYRVTYNTQGWIKLCRDNPMSRQAANLLSASQKLSVVDMFSSMRGSMTSSYGASPGRDTTLRRGASMRRAIANQAGIKRRSVAILLKFQTDSLLDTISKTGLHFVSHIVPDSKTYTDITQSVDMVLDVPCLRSQIRALQILPAIRYFRQGYPEFMTFGDFLSRYSILSGNESKSNLPLVDQRTAVEELLAFIDTEKSQYRVGLSQVFFRTSALAEIDLQREQRRAFFAIVIQKHMRRHLAEKAVARLKLKHEAMRCLQKNLRIHFKLRDWTWWKLYTKIKPLINVQKTEEDLKEKERELIEVKSRLLKVENEKNTYKKECARLEDELNLIQSDYNQERTTTSQATELLEQETSKRLYLEDQLKHYKTQLESKEHLLAGLTQELEHLRLMHESYQDTSDDSIDAAGVSRMQYDHMIKDQELKRRQLQIDLQSTIEELQDAKHKLERQLSEVTAERDEQMIHIQSLKKKVQKYSHESQDIKKQYEDVLTRNSELEKKQRRFDNELHAQAGDIVEERSIKERLQRERDQLIKQKYTLDQQYEDVCIERDALQTKLRRLEHEMTELRSTENSGDSELIALRSTKHELERQIAEQEDELADMQQEMHELEMAKLKLQMEVDKLKQKNQKDLESTEQEMEELRDSHSRKVRHYESKISDLEEELHNAMQGKRDAERRLLEQRDVAPVRDHDHERELKSAIKKLRALLTDAQNELEKQREQSNNKSQIRALETQLEDVQAALTAALKSKSSLETELQEALQQASNANKNKMETEDKLGRLMREKTDIENEKEDLEEEINELMKRYQSAVSQTSITSMTVRSQAEQISTLEDSRKRLVDEIETLNSKLSHLETTYVPKDKLVILESKCMELDQKLEYEKSMRIRFENKSLKDKENNEKLDDELSKLHNKVVEEERKCKQLQSQLSRSLESQEDIGRREIEQSQTISQLNQRIEVYEAQVHQLQNDLKSSNKRIESLQSALEQSALSDYEDGAYDTETDTDDDL